MDFDLTKRHYVHTTTAATAITSTNEAIFIKMKLSGNI